MEPLLLGLSLIDLAVVGGVALVLPVALGGGWRRWSVVAGAVALSFRAPTGSVAATVLALTWMALLAVVARALLRAAGPLWAWTGATVRHLLALAFTTVAASSLLLSRTGRDPFGSGEPIVELAAVHFTYAGAGALGLAGHAHERARGARARRLGRWAVGLTGGAPVIVATGFLTGAAVPQVGGAVLMTAGVWCTAGLELHRAVRGPAGTGERLLLAVSGVAIWAPMALAVCWAAGQHWSVPMLSIPDMARTHGAINAVAFIGAGLLALRLDHHTEEA